MWDLWFGFVANHWVAIFLSTLALFTVLMAGFDEGGVDFDDTLAAWFVCSIFIEAAVFLLPITLIAIGLAVLWVVTQAVVKLIERKLEMRKLEKCRIAKQEKRRVSSDEFEEEARREVELILKSENGKI